MKAENIGKNAGIVWRTLYHNETEMTFRELVQATQLSEIDVAAAIGWLSREYKSGWMKPRTSSFSRYSENAITNGASTGKICCRALQRHTSPIPPLTDTINPGTRQNHTVTVIDAYTQRRLALPGKHLRCYS